MSIIDQLYGEGKTSPRKSSILDKVYNEQTPEQAYEAERQGLAAISGEMPGAAWRGMQGAYLNLGNLGRKLVGADTSENDAILAQLQAERDALKAKYGDNFAFDFAEGVGGMGGTIPLDIATGGISKALLVPRLISKALPYMERIPGFALGMMGRMGAEGSVKQVPDPGSLASSLERTLNTVTGGAEGLAEGILYGRAGEIGAEGNIVSRLAKQVPTQGLLGGSMAAYEAAKEGRLPTEGELARGAGFGAGLGAGFATIGGRRERQRPGIIDANEYRQRLAGLLDEENLPPTIQDFPPGAIAGGSGQSILRSLPGGAVEGVAGQSVPRSFPGARAGGSGQSEFLRIPPGAKEGGSGQEDLGHPAYATENRIVKVEKATLAEFESSPPPGYRIKTLPGEDIARAESDGTISLDPNKFFGHGEKDRMDIIAHEKAHFLEEKIPPDVKARLFDDPVVMGYRGRNINEKLANMIQDGKLPQELKGYVEGSGGAGEGGQPPKGGEGAPPSGGGPPPEKPKQYTKVLFTKKGSDRKIDPHGKELLNDIVDIEVGIEAETGKPAVNKKYLWEMTKEEAGDILKRGGLDPSLHELAIDKAMLQGKKVPLEAMRGYFSEGDLLAAEGITGIFAMKEHEMKVWLDMKTDASLIYEHTKGLLTKQQYIDIKHEARRATGQVPASELITMREDQLLKNQLLWEVKAAREAMRKGLKEGQAVGAGRLHKAIELARARADARAEINYMIKNIKTVDPKYMTAATADEVTRLLQDLDLSKLSDKKRISLENTLDYLSRSPDTELPDYVLDDLARLHKTPIRDLSYDEIRSIHNAVMSLAAQSERVQTLVVKMREQKVQDAIKQAVTEMKDPDLVDQQIISTRPSMMDKFKGLGHWIKQNLGIRQDSFDLIIESISGINSTSYDVLYRRVKQGILTQKMSQQKAESAFRDHLRANKFYETVKDPDKWMNERVTTGRFELSRGERMSLYLHSLNEDNYSAMINGGIGFKNPPPSRGLTPNSVVRITEQEIADISRSLTREEKVMVEAAQKMFREQGVDLANEFYRLNRYRMPPQDNYYPKEVMPLRRGGLDLETEDGLEAFRQFTARVGIDKSMLIERVGSQRPIYLNDLMTDVNRSVRRATAYIGLEDAMRNASRMLYDTTYKREIIDRYGRDTWVEMEKGLKDIAGSYKAWTSFEKLIDRLRTTTVSSALSINPWVWLNQPFSLLTYWSYIEPRYLAKGLTDSITSPKDTLNGLRMYSSELIDRLKTGYDRDVAAVYAAERNKSFYGGKQTLQEKGITPTKYFDLTAVVPGMRAAVYKALDEFQTGKLSKPVRDALNVTPEEAVNWTPEQKIAKAHEFADWVTQRTQAQSTPEHRSPLSRGTPLEQMFTAFTSQTNVMLGLVRRTYRDYDRTKDPEALRSMLKAFTSVFVLNAAAMIGIDRLRDLVYGRDSKSIVAGFIDNTASLLYVVRDIERTMSSFIAEGHRGKESSVPAARFAETMKDMAVHIHDLSSDNKKVAEDAQLGVVDSMAQLMSILSGLPYQTPKRLLISATGNNPPPRRKKGEDKDFIDELLED